METKISLYSNILKNIKYHIKHITLVHLRFDYVSSKLYIILIYDIFK